MELNVTDSAISHIKKSLSSRGRGCGIRVGVKTSGCSGLSYILEFVDSPDPTHTVIQKDGVGIFIDPKSAPYLVGMTLDYGKEGLGEGFRFDNPNVKEECGCGKSFTV